MWTVFPVPFALYHAVDGQCIEAVVVTLSAAAGWSITDERDNQVIVNFFGPKAYVSRKFTYTSMNYYYYYYYYYYFLIVVKILDF